MTPGWTAATFRTTGSPLPVDSMKTTFRTLMLALALTGVVSCGGGAQHAPAMQSTGPALVVERFLQAANAGDLETMTQLFGTPEKTIVQLDGRSKAQQRMHVLASLLRHDDYQILGQRAVPGRLREATELQVQLHVGGRLVVVPHLVVRKKSGGWIVENIGLEEVTRGD